MLRDTRETAVEGRVLGATVLPLLLRTHQLLRPSALKSGLSWDLPRDFAQWAVGEQFDTCRPHGTTLSPQNQNNVPHMGNTCPTLSHTQAGL